MRGLKKYARNSNSMMALWAMYLKVGPAHLASIFCPVLVCPKSLLWEWNFLLVLILTSQVDMKKRLSNVGKIFCCFHYSRSILWDDINFFCFQGYLVVVAVGLSGLLKGKQKLGVTFNSDKLGGIDFTKFSKLTMCSA